MSYRSKSEIRRRGDAVTAVDMIADTICSYYGQCSTGDHDGINVK